MKTIFVFATAAVCKLPFAAFAVPIAPHLQCAANPIFTQHEALGLGLLCAELDVS